MPLNADLRDQVAWRSVKQSNWLDDNGWQGIEAPADTLPDLKTKGNRLSLYLLPRDNASLRTRVATALAAKRQSLDHYDFIVFEATALETIREQVQQLAGETLDREVNDWHLEVVELSADQVAQLASAMWQARPDMVRILEADMASHISDAIKAGRIPEVAVQPAIISKLKSKGLL